MGKYSVPENIRKMKPKGTMVKVIHGKYYVYEYFNRKNSEGKWAIKMGKLIGHIDEKLGFIPNADKNIDETISTLEFGQYALALANSKNTLDALLDVFNTEDALRIYLISVIHFVNGFTYLKNIHNYYENSYLSLIYPNLTMSYKSLAPLIDSLGRKQAKVMQFEQNLLNNSSHQLAIDGHVIRSCSHNNDLEAKGNKFNLLKDMQINVLMAYDINTNKPLTSRIFEGGSLDKTSIKDFMERYSYVNTLFIIDRGFYSKDNMKLFSANGNQYIIPLSPNLLEYKEAVKNLELDNAFVYEKSKKRTTIEYKEIIKENKKIIIYRDNNQSALEKTDYLKNLEIGKGKYTKEEYERIKDYFGVIVLETNNIEKSAKEIYELYKKRWKLETFFNYFKNNIDIEALHMDDYYMTQGLSFIMLIVGLIHNEFSSSIKKVKGKTIDDCLLEARFTKIHKMNNRWIISNVKKELRAMMELLNVDFAEEVKRIN